MSLGIPYAIGEVTTKGLVETCPVCQVRVLTPFSEFDSDGERKDDNAPTPYQLHWLVYHEGQRDA